jgi:NAD(P)-dependent dehydrogenase (short-subunit alcohol dehydrogenase family)
MDRLKGLVGIVTGGALGIGKATSLLMAREGASVAVTDILDAERAQVVREINSKGGRAEYWHLDVSRESEVQNDIAWGVVYLASPESKFITGAELVIDGGYTAQ